MRTHLMVRVLLVACAFALLAGCLHRRPPIRYARAARVGVAIVVDDVYRKQAAGAPEPLRSSVLQELRDRGLAPVMVDASAFADQFSRARDTERRLEITRGLADGAEYVLLIELQARYYDLVSGRFRWTVYAKLTLAEAGALAKTSVRPLELPAVLLFAHEREAEALVAVANEIAGQAGTQLDDFLGGRVPTAPAAAAAPATDSIYFVLVDRFQNGDPANDGTVDPRDPGAWHGGDLRGVIDRLDYLQALGVKTIWLSPVFKSRAAPFHGHGAFHGYWTEDLTRLDPRFGTEAELRQLVAGLHRRGMRLVLDLVVNHVGYDAPLLRAHPDWFHRRGTITRWDDPEELVNHEVHGLPDLAQEHPAVYAYLVGASRGWVDRVGVDGFRLDAVKHVPLDFWTRFNGELRAAYRPFMLLGELYDGAPDVVDRVQRRGGFTHMFDFPMAFALRDVFCGGRPAGRLGAVLATRRLYASPDSLVTFLDNHDMPRVRSACRGDLGRVRQALTAQFALAGIPALTYGTEAGLEGDAEPHNRGDMVFDAAPARDLKAHVQRLLALRAAHPALAAGATRIVGLEDGLLTFVRVAGGEAALVGLNTAAEPRRVTPPAALARAELRDALTGAPAPAALTVGPGETRILLAHGAPAELAALARTPAGKRALEVSVREANLRPGESLVMVGSGPELGNWAPRTGAGPFEKRGARYVASLALPTGVVFAYKLVVRTAAGQARWEPGEDRYVFVDEGAEAVALNLTLRRG
ncbi:MAG TPA: alpha-amylase family glycosyl hydrolase [Polyangia bacterium]|jgi:glycosidase